MEHMLISGSSDCWNQQFYNQNHKFYKSTVQALSRGGVDCAKKVGYLWAFFFYMGSPVKNQVENVLSKLFIFRGQTIDVYDQAVFTLKYSGLHDEEGNKINVSGPLIETQRR